jgi:hypothetical protein
MLLDKQNCFSINQDIGQVEETYLSTNFLDRGAAATDNLGNTVLSDLGRGMHLELLIQITEAVLSSGAATVTFQLIESDNADMSSADIIATTPAIGKAALVVGYQARLALPPGLKKRYLAMQYVIGGETTTAGTVTAGLVNARQSNAIIG